MRATAALVVLAAASACGPKAPDPGPARPAAASPVAAPTPAAPAPAVVAPATDHPPTRRDDVVDRLHGVEVRDPYRWLEDPSKPEVAAWMAAQDDYARARLAGLEGRDAIAKRLADVMYYDAVSAPIHRGGRYFYSRKHKDKEKRVVYWKAGEAGAEQVLLDPNTWSSDGSAGLKVWSVSWDGTYVAYTISEHNADETSLKVLEVATGKPLPDAIAHTRFGGISWTPDSRAFYYNYTPPASDKIAEPERNAHTEFRLHRLGGDPARDQVAHAPTGNPSWFLNGHISEDGHWLFTAISHGSSGSIDWFFKDLRKPKAGWTPLIEGVDAAYDVLDFQDRFYVTTNDGAARYHVFVVEPARPARARWREIVPETDATLQGAQVIGRQLVLLYLRNAASEMEIHGLDGKLVRKVELPPLGSASGMVGRAGEDTAYFGYSSFTEPSVIYKTSIRTGKVAEWARITLPIDTGKLVSEQVRYPSKDGTQITMFLVHGKDVAKTGKVPTLLTAYGGFRVPITPRFSPIDAVWLEIGGMIAIPNLRGGGEYGEEWHKAGMLASKQNVFDDFIAAASSLETSGWTSPDKLAIHGGSNGGLLMGAAAVQAPEKFKAIVCFVPLLDMVRYHKFGLGKAWISEYGSADEPADFTFLHAYSPYHHVTPGRRYPAFLMMSSDHDDRVDPMHARKFTAALQAASAAPVWLRIERNAGHGGADVVKQQVEEWADALAFIAHELGR
jgi:prolyl oligopeptidase